MQQSDVQNIPTRIRWFLVAGWMSLIFWFSAQPSSNEITEHVFGDWNYIVRKGAHMSEYAILFLLVRFACGSKTKALIISILYAISDEFHQSFVPHRSATISDVAIDSTGILLAWLLLNVIPRAMARQKQ